MPILRAGSCITSMVSSARRHRPRLSISVAEPVLAKMSPAVLGRRAAGGGLEGSIEPAHRAEAGCIGVHVTFSLVVASIPLRVRDPVFEQVLPERYAEGLAEEDARVVGVQAHGLADLTHQDGLSIVGGDEDGHLLDLAGAPVGASLGGQATGLDRHAAAAEQVGQPPAS